MFYPIQNDEDLIASGHYPQEGNSHEETWSIHRQRDGLVILRNVVISGFPRYAVAWTESTPNGYRVRRYAVRTDTPTLSYGGVYTFESDHALIEYEKDGNPKRQTRIDMPSGYTVSGMGGWFATGLAISTLMRSKAPYKEFLPDVIEPGFGRFSTKDVKSPTFLRKTEEVLTVNGRAIKTTLYENDNEYNKLKMWLDEHYVVIRAHEVDYRNPNRNKDFVIQDYRRA